MRYLLDTHTLLWWIDGQPLSEAANKVLEDFGNDVLVSVVSRWEISIKESKGRLQSPSDLPEMIADSGFDVLPVRWAHARRISELPPHHLDPFDRMLVAQAMVEGLTCVTRDPEFSKYAVPTLW